MKKRILSMLLTLILCVSLLPPRVNATPVSPRPVLEALVKEQYEAFTASITEQKSDYNAGKALVNMAVGKEETLTFHDENGKEVNGEKAMVASVFNSSVFHDTVIEILAQAVERMQEQNQKTLFLGGGTGWYTHNCRHNQWIYPESRFDKDEEEEEGLYGLFYQKSSYQMAGNPYDKVLALLVGSSRVRIDIERSECINNKETYNVKFQIFDRFDFTNDYNNPSDGQYDTSIAELLTMMGDLMNLNEFDWLVETEMTLEMPFSCDHTAANYQWTFDGTNLISVTGDGLTINNGTKKQYEKTDGALSNPYFLLDETVRLFHDKPWVMEFTCRDQIDLILSSTEKIDSAEPYFFRPYYYRTREDESKYVEHYVVAGIHEYYTLTEEQQKEWGAEYNTASYRQHFGVQCYPTSAYWEYRLENRIAEDGSNMVWVSVNGGEAAPMTTKYITYKTTEEVKNKELEGTWDWVSGQDFYINYIGNYNFTLNQRFESLSIWENGKEGNDHYGTGVVTPATCTEDGYTTYKCSVCGDSYIADEVDALGHQYETRAFVWSDDYASAVLQVSGCENCPEPGKELSCTVTVDQRIPNRLVYRASVAFSGQLYTEEKVLRASVSGGTVVAALPKEKDGTLVIAASYDSLGKLLDVGTANVTDGQAKVPLKDGSIKVYFADPISYTPLFPMLQAN